MTSIVRLCIHRNLILFTDSQDNVYIDCKTLYSQNSDSIYRHAKFLRETFAATRIQKQWKGFRARREYVKVRKATVVIQVNSQ